jgi:hypothetical protein
MGVLFTGTLPCDTVALVVGEIPIPLGLTSGHAVV